MRQPPPTTETPKELDDFEQVLKQLLRLPPPTTTPVRTRARHAARLARPKKTRRQVSSSA